MKKLLLALFFILPYNASVQGITPMQGMRNLACVLLGSAAGICLLEKHSPSFLQSKNLMLYGPLMASGFAIFAHTLPAIYKNQRLEKLQKARINDINNSQTLNDVEQNQQRYSCQQLFQAKKNIIKDALPVSVKETQNYCGMYNFPVSLAFVNFSLITASKIIKTDIIHNAFHHGSYQYANIVETNFGVSTSIGLSGIQILYTLLKIYQAETTTTTDPNINLPLDRHNNDPLPFITLMRTIFQTNQINQNNIHDDLPEAVIQTGALPANEQNNTDTQTRVPTATAIPFGQAQRIDNVFFT